MKIWILSSDSQIQSTKRLVAGAKACQIETEVLNPLELHFEFGHKNSVLFHQGKRLSKLPDLVLPRLGWQSLDAGLRLVKFFESLEIPVINSFESFQKATDKLLSLQLFHQAKLPIPQTRFSPLTLKSEYQIFSKQDSHVFKTLQGSQGFGVSWAENRAQSLALVDSFRTVESDFLVQEMIEESFGKDIRTFVIAGEIVASMKRQGPQNDLRSNLHQGGKSASVTLQKTERELVLKAASTLGLYYSGVDFLRTKKGPLLIEANPTPGFEGIFEISQLDIAKLLFENLLKL